MGDDKQPTQDADALGEMPDADIEPREPNPGGADALPQEASVTVADLDPEKNPAVDDEVPEEVTEGEDTATEAPTDSSESGQQPPEDDAPV